MNIQIMNNHKKRIKSLKYKKALHLNTLRIYTTFYHTYKLLYCNENIQIMSNQSNIKIE